MRSLIEGRALLSGSIEGFFARQKSSDRADNAIRSRFANECAQIHQGRVVNAGIAIRHQFSRACHNASRPRLESIGVCRSKQAREKAGDVRFNDRNGSIEGEGHDGVCGITANARQVAIAFNDLGSRPHVSR